MPNMQEHACKRALAAATERGIAVDLRYAEEVKADLEEDLSMRRHKIMAICGEDFDLDNRWQLGVVLFEKLRLRPVYRANLTYRTDNEHLKEIEHPVVEHILAYRAAGRNLGWVAACQRLTIDQRVHPKFSAAPIGRIYACRPNIQSTPRALRRLIIPDAGYALIAADWRAAQFRLLANLTGDPELAQLFSGEVDPFVTLAAMLFDRGLGGVTAEDRASAKEATYALLYGAKCGSVARRCRLDETVVKRYWNEFADRFQRTDRWMSSTTRLARKYGYVETIGGRRLDLQCKRKGRLRDGDIINRVIQGSEADLFTDAITDAAKALDPISGSVMIPLHDELVIQAPIGEVQSAAQMLGSAMTDVRPDLAVPMAVRIRCGSSWGDLYDC
ncbi:MAG: DNA polymerase I, thermostable [Firmicutes bacterium ADurb.BinA052]|jgi:DNA polymerase-1|nr:MAG: DNA polymerase I, thermostable [Firmicutes bacterium ADurb.BinA052]